MCIIIAKPEKKGIKKKVLKRSFKRNGDGAGFAVVKDDSGVEIYKGYTHFDTFYNALIKETKNYCHPALIHFRKQSVGNINYENCHPFIVGNCAMAHNGTIDKMKRHTNGDSDSLFLANLLNRVPNIDLLIKGENFTDLISYFVNPSRVVFMTPEGGFKFINRKAGEEYRGSWFSNSNYK